MVCIDGELGKKLEEILVKTRVMILGDEVKEAIRILEEAWELLPNGKYEYDDSFRIIASILAGAIKINDKECILRWKDKIMLANLKRADCGEREMWVGRANYVLGDFEGAREYMEVANNKSRGRCFRPEDSEYKKFYFNL